MKHLLKDFTKLILATILATSFIANTVNAIEIKTKDTSFELDDQAALLSTVIAPKIQNPNWTKSEETPSFDLSYNDPEVVRLTSFLLEKACQEYEKLTGLTLEKFKNQLMEQEKNKHIEKIKNQYKQKIDSLEKSIREETSSSTSELAINNSLVMRLTQTKLKDLSNQLDNLRTEQDNIIKNIKINLEKIEEQSKTEFIQNLRQNKTVFDKVVENLQNNLQENSPCKCLVDPETCKINPNFIKICKIYEVAHFLMFDELTQAARNIIEYSIMHTDSANLNVALQQNLDFIPEHIQYIISKFVMDKNKIFYPEIISNYPIKELNGAEKAYFSFNDKLILIIPDVFSSRTAQLLDIHGNLIKSLNHDNHILHGAFSYDNKLILTTSTDHTAKLWDINGNLITALNHNKVESGIFSYDNKFILTTSTGHSAKLWDINGNLIATLSHNHWATSGTFSHDNKFILTNSSNLTANLWDINGNLISTLNHNDIIKSQTFSYNSKFILTTSNDHTAKLWDINGNLIATLNHDNWVESGAFSYDNKFILTTSTDHTAKLWDINGNLIKILPHNDSASHGIFSYNNKFILTISNNDFLAKLWDINGNLLKTLRHNHWVTGNFSHNNKSILTTTTKNAAKLWNTYTSYLLSPKYMNGEFSFQKLIFMLLALKEKDNVSIPKQFFESILDEHIREFLVNNYHIQIREDDEQQGSELGKHAHANDHEERRTRPRASDYDDDEDYDEDDDARMQLDK